MTITEMMIAGVVLLFFILVLYGLIKFVIKRAIDVVANAAGGVIFLLIANFVFGLNIPYTLFTLLLCIVGGIPGVICVILLYYLGISL